MINLKDLILNPNKYKTNLTNRGQSSEIIDEILSLNEKRKKLITECQKLIVERKKLEKEVFK